MNKKRRPNTKKINDTNYRSFVELFLKGYTNEQISDALLVSLSTVSRMKRFYNETFSLTYNKDLNK
jgi:transposase